jgi:hypothetical protein
MAELDDVMSPLSKKALRSDNGVSLAHKSVATTEGSPPETTQLDFIKSLHELNTWVHVEGLLQTSPPNWMT